MWLFDTLSDLFYKLFDIFWEIAKVAREIWVVGDDLASWFEDVAWGCWDIAQNFWQLGVWADELETQIRDLLTWDSIRAEIEARFPIVTWDIVDIVDNIWDAFTTRFVAWFEDQEEWFFELGRKILIKLL